MLETIKTSDPIQMQTLSIMSAFATLFLQIMGYNFLNFEPEILSTLSYSYLVLLVTTSMGFGIAGTFIGSIVYACIFIIFHIKTRTLIPFPLVVLFIILTVLLYLIQSRGEKDKLKLEIELTDLENTNNDLSKDYSREKNLVRSLKHKISLYSQLRTIGEHLSAHLDLSDVASRTLETAPLLVEKGDLCSLFLLDSNLKEFQIYDHTTLTIDGRKIATDPQDRFNRWILRNRQSLIVDDLSEDFRFEDDLKSRNLNSIICTPLITDDKLIGALRISSVKPKTFQLEDLRLLANLSSMASTSLKNAMLYQDTLELSIRDSLTGLFVPSHFHQLLKEAYINTRKDSSTLIVMMADVDNFKQLNDQFGHTVGDNALKSIANILKDSIDERFIPTRYGGEEFSAFFENETIENIKDIAEGLRQSVEAITFIIRRARIPISISIGIAMYSEEDRSKDTLLNRADEALYRAKRTGKNKVIIDS